MEFKGTKVKWNLQNERFIWGRIGQLIAEVNYTYSSKEDNAFFQKPNDEYLANAKLIACAPELLEALIECKNFLNKVQAPATSALFLSASLTQLIKKATE